MSERYGVTSCQRHKERNGECAQTDSGSFFAKRSIEGGKKKKKVERL